jgi:hypothetical protein
MQRLFAPIPVTLLIVVAVGTPAAAAIKKVPYPEVKVELAEPYKPDPGFTAMRKAFSDAVAKKDGEAMSALVGQIFLWTMGGQIVDQYDRGRDALYNFKVAFGFREAGKDADGGVEGGPYWDLLASFATDDSAYLPIADNANMVCVPTVATIADDKVFDQARNKIETKDEGADWYFTVAETTPVAKVAGDRGPPVGKVGKVALPVLSTQPPSQEGKSITPTHYEVLMPNGKSGWVPASAIRPLSGDQLCYAKTPKGEWKIVSYDQPQEGEPDEQQ